MLSGLLRKACRFLTERGSAEYLAIRREAKGARAGDFAGAAFARLVRLTVAVMVITLEIRARMTRKTLLARAGAGEGG